MPHPFLRLAVLGLGLASLAAPVLAQDRIVLKNGSELEGRIIADTGESLVLAMSASGASGTMTFRYRSIAFVNDVDADEILRVRALASDVERRLQEHRGLELIQTIRKDVVTSSRFIERLGRDLDRLWPAARMEAARKAATRMGLLPEGFDLKARFADQSIAERTAFYDAQRRTLVLLIGTPAGDPETTAVDRFWAELGRSAEEFGITREVASVLIRENFGLRDSEAGNADRVLAMQALATGDALWTVLDDWTVDLGVDPSALGDFRQILANAPQPGRSALSRQPATFQTLWNFPSREGTAFVQVLKRVGGWKLVDRAYQEPPVSTEQILHPEKYVAGDAPTEILLADFGDAIGPNVVQLETDTLGEFRLRLVMGQHLEPAEVEAACTGWDGDQYTAYEKPNHDLAAVWFSTWDSEKDAAEFADKFRKVLQSTHDSWSSREGEPTGGLFETENDMVAIAARGSDVVVCLGIPESAFGNVWKMAMETHKGETIGTPRPKVPADVMARALKDLADRQAWWARGGTSRTAPGKTSNGVYENAALGFAIALPEDWTSKEGSDESSPAVTLENAALRTRATVAVCDDAPSLPLNVLVWGLGWGRTSVPGSENRRKPVAAVLGGETALAVTTDSVSGPVSMRRREIYGQHGRRLYRITLQAPAKDFDGLESKLSGIAKSFRYLP